MALELPRGNKERRWPEACAQLDTRPGPEFYKVSELNFIIELTDRFGAIESSVHSRASFDLLYIVLAK